MSQRKRGEEGTKNQSWLRWRTGGIRKIIDFRASSSHTGESITGLFNQFEATIKIKHEQHATKNIPKMSLTSTTYLASICSGTRSINVIAKPLRWVMTARHVWLASVVGNVSSVLNEFKGASVVTSVAWPGSFGTTIENELNRKIDVVTLCSTSNLDTISEGTDASMSPAWATVLRNVLVERVCQIGDTIHIGPAKGIREILTSEIGMGQRRLYVVMDSVVADLRNESKSREKISTEFSTQNGSTKTFNLTLISLKRSAPDTTWVNAKVAIRPREMNIGDDTIVERSDQIVCNYDDSFNQRCWQRKYAKKNVDGSWKVGIDTQFLYAQY